MPRNLKVYLLFVISIGIPLFIHGLISDSTALTPYSAFFIIALVLMDYYEYRSSGFAFSLGSANTLALIVFFGLKIATIGILIDVLFLSITRYSMSVKQKSDLKMFVIKQAFNLSQFVICINVTYYMAKLLTPNIDTISGLPVLFFLIALYNAVNVGLMTAVLSFAQGSFDKSQLTYENLFYYFYAFLIAIVLVYLYHKYGIGGAVLTYLVAIPCQKISQMFMELKEKEKELRTDTLTQIYNFKHLERTMKKKIESKKPFSVIFIDLDKFKKINDTYGHKAGDQALKTLANFVNMKIEQNKIEDKCVFCRYAGDEFCIVVNDKHSAELLANELLKDVENRYCVYEDLRFPVNLSVGIYDYESTEKDAQFIINAADKAMYQAKQRGGNTVVKCNEDNKKE